MRKIISFLIVASFLFINPHLLASTSVGTDITLDGGINVGSGATGAKVNILSSSSQLNLFYDDTHYATFLVDASNSLSITPYNSAGGWKITSDSTSPNFLAGYSGNSIGSGSYGSAIFSGGVLSAVNSIAASAVGSLILGGSNNTISGSGILATPWYNSILGGYGNIITSTKTFGPGATTIVGGQNNSIKGINENFIGGGYGNSISPNESQASGRDVIVGGSTNTTYGNGWAVITGGQDNVAWHYCTVSGGAANVAGANGKNYSTVSGGMYNNAIGYNATIAGGSYNTASGDYSFAAGRKASSTHQGAFVWADSNNLNFLSTTTNEFALRAIGGVRMVTAIDGSGGPTKSLTFSSSGILSVPGPVYATGTIAIISPIAPSASTTACTAGTITWDSGYVYVCVSANSWKRATLNSW